MTPTSPSASGDIARLADETAVLPTSMETESLHTWVITTRSLSSGDPIHHILAGHGTLCTGHPFWAIKRWDTPSAPNPCRACLRIWREQAADDAAYYGGPT